ncbi:c-type cytochrome [Serratia marcescens]|uniref:C-type cytochrome n=1 Tax=Serratia marcescens TaxID=615 RepID=A0ABD5BSE0_SERMA|nr:c-type cytochrome [Serratia marcescens]MCZ6926785.1 cytochrome C554 [Serratia marcescens]MDE5236983.1 c-type cytochrome [Serratia marcescens]MDE5260295.1 c-type cytochrome [Serratia marcescens]MDQ9378758.1 c-type cytochrome [Serratia marcescens]MDQ9404968.1 c-type cytochrome [Serratia marcescens]
MKFVGITLLAAGLFSLPALAAGDAAAGQAKAAACAACHGAQGKVTVQMYPNLAGQNAMYLQHALQAYKKGERNGGQAEVMKAYVSGLSDDDIADLAAFYASLKP